MNELIYNFINGIEDVNKIKEMTVEEFTKLVRANNLISEQDAQQLIESFKKISSKKVTEDEADDNEQRKKKYREEHKQTDINVKYKNENIIDEKQKDDDSIER